MIPKVKTDGKRLRGKLKQVGARVYQVRNRLPLKQIWGRFRAKLLGHIHYSAVSFNSKAVERFLCHATWILFCHLNRRSQRKSFIQEQFNCFQRRCSLPAVRIRHALY